MSSSRTLRTLLLLAVVVGVTVAARSLGDQPHVTTPQPPDHAPVLHVTTPKDGDSWVASDGREYRLGLVNAPDLGEPCFRAAAQFTRRFLANGFTVDAYSMDNHGRHIAEVFDPAGRSLNVALAKSGMGNGKYLNNFRRENPDLARRVQTALTTAAHPACLNAAGT